MFRCQFHLELVGEELREAYRITYPVEVNAIKSILPHKRKEILDEHGAILFVADHVAENLLRWAWFECQP